MFRNEVKQLDAIAAILCIESSTTTSPIVDIVGNALHSIFTDNPDEEFYFFGMPVEARIFMRGIYSPP